VALQGELLEKVLRRSGMSISAFARKAGISREHLYNLFERERFSYEECERFSSALGYDVHLLLTKFPESEDPLSEYLQLNIPQEQTTWQERYFRLAEKYMEFLEEQARKDH
jgi:AcrR family transcriptional regulator